MAINFLNSVDLNKNQLIKAAIESQPNDAAVGTGVEGQLYFNTTQQTIKVYREILPATTPKTYEWASISGDIEEVQASIVADKLGIDVVDPLGPIPKVGLDIVGLTALGAPALTDSLAVYDVSATTNKKLTVADIIGASTWKLEGDGANQQTIVNGDIVDFVGNTYISSVASAVSANNFAVTLTHDNTTRTNTTSTVTPISGATFTALDSITTNATGHVTAVNTKTVTTADENYPLPTTTGVVSPGAPTTGIISLTGSTDGVVSTVTFTGTTNRIDVSGSAVGQDGAITIDLTDDVTIVDDLTVGGELTVSGTGQSSFGGQITIPQTPVADTDAASKKFVLDQVAGLGSFQGGYDASTDPGSPALTGASNIAFGQGDFYAVTTAGTITFSDSPTGDATLEVGDFIFSNTDITANSNPASTDFTLILADQNIAGSGATDGATPKGVAGFDSANFDVSATGWVQLNSQRNPYGAKVTLNNTSPVSRATTGTPVDQTTFTVSIDDASIFGSGALAANVKVEVLDNAAPFETVYPLVERSGSGTLAIKFTGDVAVDLYQVLLSHI